MMKNIKKKFLIILLPFFINASSQNLSLTPGIKISQADYQSLSLEEIIILRNSIFAHYGYIFKSETMGKYYSKTGRYKPNKNFKYSMLTKTDQYNVKTLVKAEKLLKKKLIRKLWSPVYAKKRYFFKGAITSTLPKTTAKGMLHYCTAGPMTKELAVNIKDVQAINFSLLSVSLSSEKSRSTFKAAIRKKKAHPGSSFEYWVGHYDRRGLLRRLENIQYDSRYYDRTVKYYFDEKGKLLYASGNLIGTVGFSIYYQYLNKNIAWIELVIQNVGAAGVDSPGSMKKFYL